LDKQKRTKIKVTTTFNITLAQGLKVTENEIVTFNAFAMTAL